MTQPLIFLNNVLMIFLRN